MAFVYIIGGGIAVFVLMFLWDRFNIKHDGFQAAHDVLENDPYFPRPITFGNVGPLGDTPHEVAVNVTKMMDD